MMSVTRSETTQSGTRRLRVGGVNYLNSKPLLEGLTELASETELVLDYPSHLADGLASGDLDVALIPSVECLANPDYEIVSDACVATRGPVLSVKLYSRVPPEQIRSIALDEGSRTSAALARVMLAERHDVFPKIEPLPLGCSTDATRADAVLLIGDRAMHPLDEQFHTTWDLGEEWLNWTGLPFVFAMWTARRGVDLGSLEEALNKARDLGVARFAEIAEREAGPLGLSVDQAFEYLTRNLHFQLGSAEKNALSLFCRLARRLGVVPEGGGVVFRNCITAG